MKLNIILISCILTCSLPTFCDQASRDLRKAFADKDLTAVKAALEAGGDPFPSEGGMKFATLYKSVDHWYKPDWEAFKLMLPYVQVTVKESPRGFQLIERVAMHGAEYISLTEKAGFPVFSLSEKGKGALSGLMGGGYFAEAKNFYLDHKLTLQSHTPTYLDVSKAVYHRAGQPWRDEELAETLEYFQRQGFVFLDTPALRKYATRVRLIETAKSLGLSSEDAEKIVPFTNREMILKAYYQPDKAPDLEKWIAQEILESDDPEKAAHDLFHELLSKQGVKNEMLDLLLKYKIDLERLIQAKGGTGFTPLQATIANQNLSALKLLVENGADVNAITQDGTQTGLSLAVGIEKYNHAFLELLFKHGAVVQEKKTGIPLISTAMSADWDPFSKAIRILIENGADPYYTKKGEKPVIDELVEQRHMTAVQLLDLEGRYKEITDNYNAPSTERIAGFWWNEKNEFSTFKLALTSDNMAIISTPVRTNGFYPYRMIDKNTAVMVITSENDRRVIKMEVSEDGQKLKFSVDDKSGFQLVRENNLIPPAHEEWQKNLGER